MRRCFGCSSTFGSPTFAVLSRAAAKSASARLRNLGVLRVDAGWQARVAACAGCPLRTVVRGVTYCGQPLLRRLDRSPADGCGCPVEDKARRPGEHCPLAADGTPRRTPGGTGCDCKWCQVGQAAVGSKSTAVPVAGR
jgi:hypothetical protein